MCDTCRNPDDLLRLGYPRVCDRTGCDRLIGLHDDNWTRADIMHDNRVGLGPLSLCSPQCVLIFYQSLVLRTYDPTQRIGAYEVPALSVESINRILRLTLELVSGGQPITRGNSGFCLYCTYEQEVTTEPRWHHAPSCVWVRLCDALGQQVKHEI